MMTPKHILEQFNIWLIPRKVRLDAVIVGGSALALLGVVDRQTRDVDVLTPILSAELMDASIAFARHVRENGQILADDWMNNGPSEVASLLPSGWEQRTRYIYQDQMISLQTLGYEDLLKTKLFALCDRGTDLADCIALQPTVNQVRDAEEWLAAQDAHPAWPVHVHDTLEDLIVRLNHGV